MIIKEKTKYRCLICGKEIDILYVRIDEKWQCEECYHNEAKITEFGGGKAIIQNKQENDK